MQETRVRPLGREDPLKLERATHSSILAWKIPCTEEPDGLQSKRVGTQLRDWAYTHTHLNWKERARKKKFSNPFCFCWRQPARLDETNRSPVYRAEWIWQDRKEKSLFLSHHSPSEELCLISFPTSNLLHLQEGREQLLDLFFLVFLISFSS